MEESNNFSAGTPRAYEYREEAIPLVVYNEEKRCFEINEESREFLKSLQAPLGIISVAGMYRTGKSYLLNRMLLNRSSGFGVGSTINACTKGVWVWGKPVQGFTPDGDPINILILDTEGLGALDEDSNHDVRIFSLAILLSSFFIYNSVGSIDENALTNLSLVINLTKHIHLKQSGVSEDVDPEEYAQYFPSFMWVVRDFTLQLVDLEGESITQKEYLEKALGMQKGFSDSVEQKNRIRRMLKSFFKERDCCTMVRPLTNEDDLQLLEKTDLDKLRPEFVEQVMSLRRKVINRIKPKMIHGKKLNGEMLFNLAHSYVEAINKGVVPSIENSWTYICKNQCQKAIYDAYEIFEKTFQESYEMKTPMYEEDLKDCYNQAKANAIDVFQKAAVGEVIDEYREELKARMKAKFNSIQHDNQEVSKQQIIMFLHQQYQSIENRLREGQYDTIYGMNEDLKGFQEFILANAPPGPNREVIVYEFCQKALAEGSEFLFRNITSQINLQTQLATDAKQKLEKEIAELKQEYKEKVESVENKLRNADSERAELSAKEQSLRENYTNLQKEKDKINEKFDEQVKSLKADNLREIEDLKEKMNINESQQKEIQRQSVASEMEFDKQKALLEQKVEFYEKSLDEAQKKEKELAAELKQQKRDFFNQTKDVGQKFEQQIKDLTKANEQLKEDILEWECKFQDLDQKFELEKQQYEDSENKLKKDLKKALDQVQEMTHQNQQFSHSQKQEMDQILSKYQSENSDQKSQIEDLISQLQQSKEQQESIVSRFNKENAINKQKLEFIDLQLKEERTKYIEQKQNHENMLNSIQDQQRQSVIGKEEATKRINEIKESYVQENKELEKKYEESRQRLSHTIDQLTEKNQQLELSLKLQVGDLQKEIENLKMQLSHAEEHKSQVSMQSKLNESMKMKLLDDAEKKYNEKIRKLEKELEDLGKENDAQIQEINTKSEENLIQLKNFYESEKERLEQRSQQEKEKNQKRINQMIEEYEQKLSEQAANLEEELQMAQDEKREQEMHMQDIINQLDHENSLNKQQIEALEKYLQETKDSNNNLQRVKEQAIEQQQQKFDQERKEMLARIEKITSDLTKKDRALTTLENQHETYQTQLKQKEKQLESIKEEVNADKNQYMSKYENLRTKHEELLDEITSKKIEQERERALKDQQISFQDQKINDLSKQLESSISRYEERIKTERDEHQKELSEKIQRITDDKDQTEQKYDQKRRAMKEMEAKLTKAINQLEREKVILEEKHGHLHGQKEDLHKSHADELDKLKSHIEELNMSNSGNKAQILEEVEKWKREYNELDRQHQDQINTYDKDKALWEGKFKFLEQQRDNYKKDFDDAQVKFQRIVEQLQQSQNESKNKTESQHGSMIAAMENKYNQTIKEMQDAHQNQVQDFINKNKELERNNKLLSDKLDLINKSNANEADGLGKKLERAIQEKEQLSQDLDQIKTERDKKISEYQRQNEVDRENMKVKLRESEQKSTRIEARQTEMLLGFEKERAKWDQEKSQIINSRDEAVQDNKILQRKTESYIKEIEKLKNEQKNLRKQQYHISGISNNYQSQAIGNSLANKLGKFGFQPTYMKDSGATSYRSNLQDSQIVSGASDVNKSYMSGHGVNENTGGAVGGLKLTTKDLNNSMTQEQNMLSTPQSTKNNEEMDFSSDSHIQSNKVGKLFSPRDYQFKK